MSIRHLVERHKRSECIGITSVCSAHPLVLQAVLVHALRRHQKIVLIEATSNQVNQDGGYTGMTPVDFRNMVFDIAARAGFPREKIVLGGDHLGPNAWTALGSEEAMRKAHVMVADYVRAGFGKIHLDCSMSCADDPIPLPERTIAERAAILCRAAEDSWEGAPHDAPCYVIGTEVPVPGGAEEDLSALTVTRPQDMFATLAMHRDLFKQNGLDDAWDRVIAIVTQPGVEFDHDKVIDYHPEAARDLSKAIEGVEHVVFEAHSTDYQTANALRALVRDHFAILKVGPGVTFALREALWALDAIERETVPEKERGHLRETMIARMRAEPAQWQRYYHASGEALTLQLHYSLSDRIRYYWPKPDVIAAQEKLFDNLIHTPPSLPLLSQYLPTAYTAVREGVARLNPVDLIVAHISATLDAYHGACHPDV